MLRLNTSTTLDFWRLNPVRGMPIHRSRVIFLRVVAFRDRRLRVSGAMILFLKLSWNRLHRYLLLERLWSAKAAWDLDFVGAIHVVQHIIISRLLVFDNDLYPWNGLLHVIAILHTVSLDVKLHNRQTLNLVSSTRLVPYLNDLLLLLWRSDELSLRFILRFILLNHLIRPPLVVLLDLHFGWLLGWLSRRINVETLVHHCILVF